MLYSVEIKCIRECFLLQYVITMLLLTIFLLRKFVIKIFKNLSNLTNDTVSKRFIYFKYQNRI